MAVHYEGSVRSVMLLLLALTGVLAPAAAQAQACPADRFCFYVPPGLPVEASHSVAASRQFDIVLSSPVRTVSGTYSVAGAAAVSFSVSPGASVRIPLGEAVGPASAYGVPERNGVFLVADSEDLTVDHRETYGEEQYSETIKRSSIALGSRFRLGGYSLDIESRPDAGIDAALIYAPTGATVTLRAPPGATLPFWSGTDGDVYTATLSAGQTVAVRTLVGRDLDGALLTSSTEVAVSTGGRGWSTGGCGDDGMDGLVPVSALGTEYVVRLPTGSDARNNESRVRVIADSDQTEVRINGVLVSTLAAGAAYNFQPDTLSHVRTSRPALVWMNGSLDGCELDTVLIPPIAFAAALTLLSLDFNVLPSDQTPPGELAILIPTSQVGSILLNGAAPVVTSSETVPERPDLSYVRFDVAAGDQNVLAGSDFQALLASRTRPSGLLAYYNPFRIPGCGDSANDTGEACDDGNLQSGDGCSSVCQVEPGYVCTGVPSACAPACGNGVLSPVFETCDDGNLRDGDGCSAACRAEVVINAPADGALTRERTPTVRGSADPLASVSVGIGDVVGTVIASASGAWSFTPASVLADGLRVITATAVDTRGGSSSAMRTLTIDSEVNVVISQPAIGAVLTTPRPTLRGLGEVGARVEVRIDDSAVGGVQVDTEGAWSVVLTAPLAEGEHRVRASISDPAGNQATVEQVFVLDSVTQVTLAQPMIGDVLRSATPDLRGQGEPGAEVTISIDGRALDTVRVAADGTWSVMITSPLPGGPHEVGLSTTDGAGNTATATGTFSVLLPAAQLLINNPPDGSRTRETTPPFTGQADPGALVSVAIDGVLLGTFRSTASGSWSVTLLSPLPAGAHVLWASSTDALGVTLQDEHTFTVEPSAPSLRISVPRQGAVVRDSTPTVMGTSEPGLQVEVTIDAAPAGSVTVAADGRWSLESSSVLPDGPHAARATVQAAGGQSASTEVGFRTDTSTAVRIIVPARGSVVGAARPTFAGTSEPRAMLMISVDGVELEAIDTLVDGSWLVVAPTPLSAGPHRISAAVMDALGNEASDSSDFTYDPGRSDSDGDGREDADECRSTPCADSDGDGLRDAFDPDDDGDGLPSVLECWSTPCRDSDDDGQPDVLDADDDDDGRPTREELGQDGLPRDTDGDRTVDHLDPDDDRDGLPTRVECESAPCPDTDADGVPDYLDPDDDGDELPTGRERSDADRFGNDLDGDGWVSWLDDDANDNGVVDGIDGLIDADGDQVPDYLDPDQDAPPALRVSEDGYEVAGGAGCSVGARRQPIDHVLIMLLVIMVAGRTRKGRRLSPAAEHHR